MNLAEFDIFASSFGLIRHPCKLVAADFLSWQQNILQKWGFKLEMTEREAPLGEALKALRPLTAPIVTRYLFWPVDEDWTLYFDNGAQGTDAGPPSVLSSRLGVGAMRVVMADEVTDPDSGQVRRYRATILECYSGGVERRHIFVVNDGGKWKFGQSGEPFAFEDTAAYNARSISDRFTNAMLLDYLKKLGVDLAGEPSSPAKGYLLEKQGEMPASYIELP